MKALVGAFNQEKALVGAFSVIVQPVVDCFTALVQVRGVRPNLPRQAEPRHPHAPLPQDRDPGVPRARLQQDLQTQVHTTSAVSTATTANIFGNILKL